MVLKMPVAMPTRPGGTVLTASPSISPQGRPMPALPRSVVCNSVEMRIFLALRGQGIACLPDFTEARQLQQGLLQTVLDDCVAGAHNQGTVWMVWPPGRGLSPKVRAFLDFMAHRLFA